MIEALPGGVAPLPSPIPVVEPESVAPSVVDADMTAGEAAFTVLRAQYQAMRDVEPLVRKGGDPEDLHKMRVATRRLRAALIVFEAALPARAPRIRDQFRWIASLLGAVRDLDVHLSHIDRWMPGATQDQEVALNTLATILDARRSAARERLLGGLESQRLERLNMSFERFLDHGPVKRSPPARVRILDAAPDAIFGAYRKVVTIGDRLSPETPADELHSLRIKAKRLRYTVEFVEPVYGKPARAYIKRVTALQDLLGDHQDAVVAAAMLRDIALKERRIDRNIVLSIGALTQRYRAEAEELRESFPKRYSGITGPRWRKLLRVLEQLRDKPPEPEHGPMFGVIA